MSPQHFLDTNVLVYAAAGKRDDFAKYEIANSLILSGNFAISAQVLGEFYSTVRFPQHEMLDINEAQNWVHRLTEFCILDVDAKLVSASMFIKERFKIRFWDAALIAASHTLGLNTLYTEDLSHGQKYGSVTVINPFKAN
jgi:predicted nucleic acid-binding protein